MNSYRNFNLFSQDMLCETASPIFTVNEQIQLVPRSHDWYSKFVLQCYTTNET